MEDWSSRMWPSSLIRYQSSNSHRTLRVFLLVYKKNRFDLLARDMMWCTINLFLFSTPRKHYSQSVLKIFIKGSNNLCKSWINPEYCPLSISSVSWSPVQLNAEQYISICKVKQMLPFNSVMYTGILLLKLFSGDSLWLVQFLSSQMMLPDLNEMWFTYGTEPSVSESEIIVSDNERWNISFLYNHATILTNQSVSLNLVSIYILNLSWYLIGIHIGVLGDHI